MRPLFTTPANVMLRRAQLILMLVVLIPTVLMSGVGIVLLASGSRSVTVVAGVLVLAFCTSSLTGYILGSIFVSRGASLAKVQNEFLSSVSHELRTPLTSMHMFIDTLRGDRVTDTGERERCLTILEQELRRLEVLIDKLMSLYKIESGRYTFERAPTSIRAVCDEALAAFESVRLDGEIDLVVNVDPDLKVVGDRFTLAQALLNLLTNAWRYTPKDDKRIVLTAGPHGDKQVQLEVADNGPGIKRGDHRRIFEKFERGDSAGSVSGSGLGLAIVRAIVRAHNGRVDVRPSDHGARFRILLPRAQS